MHGFPKPQRRQRATQLNFYQQTRISELCHQGQPLYISEYFYPGSAYVHRDAGWFVWRWPWKIPNRHTSVLSPRMLGSRQANGHFPSSCPHSALAGQLQSMEASCPDNIRGFLPHGGFACLCVCKCRDMYTYAHMCVLHLILYLISYYPVLLPPLSLVLVIGLGEHSLRKLCLLFLGSLLLLSGISFT